MTNTTRIVSVGRPTTDQASFVVTFPSDTPDLNIETIIEQLDEIWFESDFDLTATIAAVLEYAAEFYASVVVTITEAELLTLAFNSTDLDLPTEIHGPTFELTHDRYSLELYTDEMHLVDTARAELEAADDFDGDYDSIVASWQA